MPLRTQLLPEPGTAKIHALVFGPIDVARPKEPDVAVREGVLRRQTAEGEVDVMRRDESEPRPAFEMKRRRRRLMQLGLLIGKPLELNPCISRLKEDLPALVAVTFVAVEDVLEVQTGDGRHEQISWLGLVNEAPDAVVACPVIAGGRVVTDHG